MPVCARGTLGGRISLRRKANVLFACACRGLVSIRAADKPVSFTEDIRPVFESSCWKCHGSAIQLSKLDLRTRDGALKGGEKGAAIVPGKAEESRLYRLVAGLEKPSMPMDGKLTADQISAIREWINQGAPWDAASEAKPGVRPPQLAVARGDGDLPGGAQLLGVSEARAICRCLRFPPT